VAGGLSQRTRGRALPYGRSRPEEDDEDERRLAFVGISRPQVLLYLTYCRTRRLPVDGADSRPEPRQPSRYLRSLPAQLVEHAA
jgi:superfamily I DNA/RNA helicase